MPIEFSTVYTKERLLRYQMYTVVSKRWFWFVLGICTVLTVGIWTWMSVIDEVSFFITLYMVLLLWIDLVYVVCYFIVPRFTVKKQTALNTTVQYTFDTDCFRVHGANEHTDESSTSRYSLLIKIRKNKSDLYLFIAPRVAFVADLTVLSPEQTAALKELLYSKVDPKKIKWPD